MLIASNYILNHCESIEEYIIYPWITTTCNMWNSKNILKLIQTIPGSKLSLQTHKILNIK